MTVEAAYNYPSDLNASLPDASDNIPEGDDHIKGIKKVLKTTLPNVSGAITPTHTELNYVDGVTSAIQTQLNAKAPIASPALTGTPTAPTPAVGVGTTQIATMEAVARDIASASMSATTPTVLADAGKFWGSDGTNVSWTAPVAVASQAQMEAASANTVFASPGTVNWHPGVAKAWLQCDAAGTVDVSHNVTSVTDGGTGILTVTIATDFSGANYVPLVSTEHSSTTFARVTGKLAGATSLVCRNNADTGDADPTKWFIAFFGDQA